MKSLEELRAIREKMQGNIGFRSENSNDTRVVVGMATCGIASGARPVLTTLSDEVQKRQLEHVKVSQTGCIGLCQYEPIVEIYEPGKEKVTYVKVNPEKALDILEQHVIRGQVVDQYMLHTDENI
ncbi:2FeCpFd [uncultured Roseburia sp.]|uniref:(2Fe-2S) ferredoxin domain-containing protein n=1 Tax=Brotonthovivens ammoniilytica TaxID=2981725 RepID=A0ABT2TIE6_9FIRM|nr:(2Fe-2S) ferredoxin domain-containing protein [Brotonthovivens ammoniilytica]MCU6761309.1 (2Fe-2S) ferredoxin domain-containing protein [Brotonthovivens ammoniilytica]SCI24893.1 2FeCpFd [uncultured Roseburia sp.]